jgi:hypothetical protein
MQRGRPTLRLLVVLLVLLLLLVVMVAVVVVVLLLLSLRAKMQRERSLLLWGEMGNGRVV